MNTKSFTHGLAALFLAAITALPAAAADLTLKVVEKDPPAELAEPIKDVLQNTAIQLTNGDGKPVWEFWFVKELPLNAKPDEPGDALEEIEEVQLVGAVHLHKSERDFRDDEILPGVYTMRFGLQPEDGNHLGTSLYDYFVMLIMADMDTTLEGFPGHDELVRASQTDTPAEHPVILSLRPPWEDAESYPVIHEPDGDKKSICVEVPAKAGDEETTAVFDLVFEGIGVL
jgi:hypothetical protein